jgi:type II protein arginine methyltransferase|eukprot:g7948.t1
MSKAESGHTRKKSKKNPKAEPPRLFLGRQELCVPNLPDVYDKSLNLHFDFVVFPMVHPRAARDPMFTKGRNLPFTRSDLLLSTEDWTRCVVGAVSEWISFSIDSPCKKEIKAAEQALEQEIAWSKHLGLPAILLPQAVGSSYENYAHCLSRALHETPAPHMWIVVPLFEEAADGDDGLDIDGDGGGVEGFGGSNDQQWKVWNDIRVMCGHSSSLSVCLKIGTTLPRDWADVSRWFGEPVKAAMLSIKAFSNNEAGYPVLPKEHKQLVFQLIHHDIQIILTGKTNHQNGLTPHIKYLHHLRSLMPAPLAQEQAERPYYDFLQEPLQPLFHNLESATYNVFEQCPVKYMQYERAIAKCLQTRRSKMMALSGRKHVTLMVVGAGRGPLVKCALRAAKSTETIVNIYAVEKNPNAVVTLKCMFADVSNVTVVSSDMRVYDPPEKADILVSELLGSFADNELSPECLDGAQKFLVPGHGVSIPCDSTSFVAPIMTTKLWENCKRFKDAKHMQTPYVVRFFDFHQLAGSKKCFFFQHPNEDDVVDNCRFQRLHFRSNTNALCHGLAGYFESTLFDDVAISINPQTISTGMTSWFPIYFPVLNPFPVQKGQVIEAAVWRRATERKVWYEWCITKPVKSAIHNVNGKHSWIGL